jgi:hypothetical protein
MVDGRWRELFRLLLSTLHAQASPPRYDVRFQAILCTQLKSARTALKFCHVPAAVRVGQ